MNIYVDTKIPENKEVKSELLEIFNDINTFSSKLYQWLKSSEGNKVFFVDGESGKTELKSNKCLFIAFKQNKNFVASIEVDYSELIKHYGVESSILDAKPTWPTKDQLNLGFTIDEDWQEEHDKKLNIEYYEDLATYILPYENYIQYALMNTNPKLETEASISINKVERYKEGFWEEENYSDFSKRYKMNITTKIYNGKSSSISHLLVLQ